jgi:hypothetical protein
MVEVIKDDSEWLDEFVYGPRKKKKKYDSFDFPIGDTQW